ncbi:MAG: HesA/MoeB/ThiF family protein [Burkholderiales bacterium]|jgi:molybdopterin/thiamine biosynthesis adenylyltransferase|nr:HesA/MoeB/ThiF family protein [Burkholderiales bacterium]
MVKKPHPHPNPPLEGEGVGAPVASPDTTLSLKGGGELRYSRHLLLNEWGQEAQAKCAAAHAVIVGAGGLGSPAAHFLAAAGVGTITLCDDDDVDLTNIQRQMLYATADIGKRKVEAARDRLRAVNPDIALHVRDARMDEATLCELARAADVVLDCTDNYKTRHAINRACVAARAPLVSGAAIRFYGQVTVFDLRNNDSPCYHCLFGENESLEEARAATLGVLAPLVGIVGTTQAAEALKLLTGIGEPLTGRLLMVDALTMRWETVRVKRSRRCPVCSGREPN